MNNVNTISIYLGDTCNFNCKYCDRDYIKSLGGQNMSKQYIKQLNNFLQWAFDQPNKIDRIALHGGEPFLYVKRMDEILDSIKEAYLDDKGLYVSITTNASLFEKEQWFLEKWRKYLRFTISYDFIYQDQNREPFDIYKSIELCGYYNIPIHWQFVMPVQDKRVFSLDCIKDILDKVSRCKIRSINLIPLRHHRGGQKFKTLIEDMDMSQYADAFMRFVNTLYNYNIMVFIDGNYGVTDKNYFGDHYKVILSPDGYIYSEYDFCEYKRPEYQVGKWVDNPYLNRAGEPDEVIPEKCAGCTSRSLCGLKYLHKMFDTEPGTKCVQFYQIQDAMVKYTTKLHEKKSFFHWIADGQK